MFQAMRFNFKKFESIDIINFLFSLAISIENGRVGHEICCLVVADALLSALLFVVSSLDQKKIILKNTFLYYI